MFNCCRAISASRSLTFLSLSTYTQASRNRKEGLHGAADTGIAIVGMESDVAKKLYLEIGEFATQEKFVYRHQYQLNNLVIWDNAQSFSSRLAKIRNIIAQGYSY